MKGTKFISTKKIPAKLDERVLMIIKPVKIFIVSICILALAACGKNETNTMQNSQETTEPEVQSKNQQLMPVSNDGKELFDNVCGSCHVSGALGAPKYGDKSEWQERIIKGKDALYTSVFTGMGSMPAKGGAMEATDEEIKQAVDYIINNSQ